MKHLILLVVISIITYAAWSYTPPEGRAAVKAFARRHMKFAAGLALVVVLLILVGYYTPAVNLL